MKSGTQTSCNYKFIQSRPMECPHSVCVGLGIDFVSFVFRQRAIPAVIHCRCRSVSFAVEVT